jgi:heme-degrading monooxygenase HmoA
MPARDAIAHTPEPPYYAVIFTSLRTDLDEGYGDAAERMMALAATMPGFLGVESAREGVGITVSYWADLESIAAWRRQAEHVPVQARGRRDWYSQYSVRVARVERARGFEREGE